VHSLLGRAFWEYFLTPSLRVLTFEDIQSEYGPPSPSSTRERVKEVADVLLVNKQVEEIILPSAQTDWDIFDATKIECNIYRKRFLPTQKIKVLSTRAAIPGRVIARVERNPRLAMMALSQNHDIGYC
jgi:hypothetical protein